ncbi:unnamed protein product, partial [Candidula unifasciata]
VCSPNWKDTTVPAFTFSLGRCTFTDPLDDSITDNFMPFFENSGKTNYIRKIDNRVEYYYGMASFGFSVDSDKSSVFVMGAPGVTISEGTVVILDVNTRVMSNYTTALVNKLYTTAFGYIGYSVKIGRFCDGTDTCFAASAPNSNRVGMILIYRWVNQNDLQLIQKFEERQAWSYFGYTLCAVDTNGDVYDELLVGAPLYTDIADTHHGHDQGRVFIYARSTTSEKLMQKGYLDGTKKKFARFGTAIQKIGDINVDNYTDVAVGAPGEDDGAGCIYIYLGGLAGLVNSPSQRITAKEVSTGLSEPVTGFGFSFSDYAVPGKEAYPVFVATSVASDTIFVLRTRPIVDVTTSLTADPNPVDDEKPCREKGIVGVCFKVKLCMKYKVRRGSSQQLSFQVGLNMDVQVRSNLKRAMIRLNNTNLVESVPEFMKNMTVADRDYCTDFVAVLREHQVNQDRFTPLIIVAKYVLLENPSLDVNPMLDATKSNNVSLTVTFANKCGDDNICRVDLAVKGSLSYKHAGNWNNIVVNGTEELHVNIGVKNSKETSYWTVIKVEVDSPVSYSRFTSGVSINCQEEQSTPDDTNAVSNRLGLAKAKAVLCNYYKPLHQNATFDLTVVFATEPMELTKGTLQVTAQALPKNVNNPEETMNDNTLSMITSVQMIADVSVEGTSSPSEVSISEAKQISPDKKANGEIIFRKTGIEIKPHNVTHKILVKNNGPSFLPQTKIAISVPVYLLDGTEFISYAEVKITTVDGKVAQCYGTKQFESLEQTTSSVTATTETHPAETSRSTSGTQETTTFGFPPINTRKKRAADDKEENKVYTLNCDVEEICQVYICETGTIIQSGSHAEINVSLVVDLANIPLPENNNSFHYTVQAKVIEPVHPLFKSWEKERVIQTVTKFQLVQSGGKINIWIIIGCVIAGLVLITIIVLIFWKLGFFKRDKHQQVEKWRRESKRLSRKGYSKAPDEDGAPAEANPDASS